MARALDEGAADYLVKPFSAVELAARIRAALRRRDMPEPSAPYVLGDLTIDYAEHRVSLAGRPVQLTAIEYRTLAELASNAGRVLTYEHLLRRVWRLEADADLRPMHTVIRSLRRKLGDDFKDPTYIFTQLRVGYRMPRGGRGNRRHEGCGPLMRRMIRDSSSTEQRTKWQSSSRWPKEARGLVSTGSAPSGCGPPGGTSPAKRCRQSGVGTWTTVSPATTCPTLRRILPWRPWPA